MSSTEFIFCGKIRGQGRPKAAKTRNGHVHIYEDSRDKDYKRAITESYLAQCGTTYISAPAPVSVTIYIQRHLPKQYQRKTERIEQPDTMTPDADNVAKAVLDALNGLAYTDDAQVVDLHVVKLPRVATVDNLDHMLVHVASVPRLIAQNLERVYNERMNHETVRD